jgi:hypothetical protein
MKLVTYTAVVVLAMATAAFADSGSSTPTPLTPANGPSMQKSAAAAPSHSGMTSNARSEDRAENPITAQLNEQQLKQLNSGAAPMRYSAGPQGTGTLSNPNNCSPGMNGCAPDSAGPAKSNDADSPR